MSIILGMLDSLEARDDRSPSPVERTALRKPGARHPGASMTAVVLAVLLSFTGAALLLWMQSVEQVNALPSPREAYSPRAPVSAAASTRQPQEVQQEAVEVAHALTLDVEAGEAPQAMALEAAAPDHSVEALPSMAVDVVLPEVSSVKVETAGTEVVTGDPGKLAAKPPAEATLPGTDSAKPGKAPDGPDPAAPPAEIVATVVQPTPPAEDGAVDEARVALASGRYFQALSVLQRIESTPELGPDFWMMKGSAHLGLGQLDLAQASFDSAAELLPGSPHVAVQQAIVLQERGDHEGALRILADASGSHPNVPEIFLNKGYSEQALGATSEARRSFRAFLLLTEGRAIYSGQREVVSRWLRSQSVAQGRGLAQRDAP